MEGRGLAKARQEEWEPGQGGQGTHQRDSGAHTGIGSFLGCKGELVIAGPWLVILHGDLHFPDSQGSAGCLPACRPLCGDLSHQIAWGVGCPTVALPVPVPRPLLLLGQGLANTPLLSHCVQ